MNDSSRTGFHDKFDGTTPLRHNWYRIQGGEVTVDCLSLDTALTFNSEAIDSESHKHLTVHKHVHTHTHAVEDLWLWGCQFCFLNWVEKCVRRKWRSTSSFPQQSLSSGPWIRHLTHDEAAVCSEQSSVNMFQWMNKKAKCYCKTTRLQKWLPETGKSVK